MAPTTTTFREQVLSSLVVLPLANALGHLAPAIGASWAAANRRIWDYPVLALLFSVHALLDSYDKYRDMPSSAGQRLSWFIFWASGLGGIIIWAAFACGYQTAIRLVWYLGLEVLWPAPLVPMYSAKHGRWSMIKLKQVFGPFKSVFCGVMAGLMDASPAALHTCILDPSSCSPSQQRFQALAYSVLYNFHRETIYDARDIVEDGQDGITTLATALGMRNTILALTIAALAGEACIGGQLSTWGLGRAVAVVGLSSWVARFPRESRWVWGVFSLLSLVPAWHAQAGLGRQEQYHGWQNVAGLLDRNDIRRSEGFAVIWWRRLEGVCQAPPRRWIHV